MINGDRIKALRRSQKMTQEELASKLDTTKQNIWKYEHDRIKNIPFDKVKIMADLFHVTPDYICGWSSDSSINGKEQELIDMYRMLNSVGKENVRSYIKFMSSQSSYTE